MSDPEPEQGMLVCWYGWAWIGLACGLIAGVQFGIAIGLMLA